jgi:hypothetical protein
VKQFHNSMIKIDPVNSLNYLRDDCHKQAVTHIWESQRFELMYILQGKTQPTHHTVSTLSPCMVQDHMYLTWSTYSNLLWDVDRFGRIPLSREKGLPTQSSFSLEPTNQAVGVSEAPVGDQLLGLLAHKHQACDRYVQYLLAGTNPSVLNRHNRGL